MRRLGARAGRRVFSGAGVSAPAAVTYYGWDPNATHYYYATGENGISTGFLAAALYIPNDLSVRKPILSTYNGSGGWQIDVTNTNGMRFLMRDGVGLKQAPAGTLAAGDIGKVMMHVLYFDGSTLHGYLRRVESGGGTAASGFTSSGLTVKWGARGDLTEVSTAGSTTLMGFATFRGTASLAEIQAYYDAVKTASAMTSTLGSMTLTHLVNHAGGSPNPIVATTGNNMTKSGTESSTPTMSSLTWSW